MAAESIYSALMEIKDILISNGWNGSNSGSGGSSANGPVVIDVTIRTVNAVTPPTSIESNYSPAEIADLLEEGRIGAFKISMAEELDDVFDRVVGTNIEWVANSSYEAICFDTEMDNVCDSVYCNPKMDDWTIRKNDVPYVYVREDTSVNVWPPEEEVH